MENETAIPQLFKDWIKKTEENLEEIFDNKELLMAAINILPSGEKFVDLSNPDWAEDPVEAIEGILLQWNSSTEDKEGYDEILKMSGMDPDTFENEEVVCNVSEALSNALESLRR